MSKEETLLPLLMLERGDKGTVLAIEGGKDFKDWVSELGIKKGCEIEFLSHIAHESLILKIAGAELRIGPDRASRVWVEVEGRAIQLNYLEEGKTARVTKVIGGTRHRQQMEEIGLREGVEITLVGREPSVVSPLRRGNYVSAKLGDQLITIGRGMAEKVWVD
jgi:Fe2+ transport system protein FeoA